MASSDLYDALVAFHDVCYAALLDTVGGQPDCHYIAPGPPAWDSCPCMIVYAGGPAVGDTFPLQPSLNPMHRVTTFGEVDLVSMTCTVLRCVPSLSDEANPLPQPADFNASARETSEDLWAIWNHLKQAKRDEVLFPPKQREFALDPAVAVNPAGGCGGWQVTMRVQLPGYKPTSSP